MAAGILMMALILPSFGCNKNAKNKAGSSKEKDGGKYYSGKTIKETDTYFTPKVNDFQFPLKEGKTPKYMLADNCTYANGYVIAQYSITYEYPEGIFRNANSNIDWSEYFDLATGLFDRDGRFIREISTDQNDLVAGIASDKDGNICMLYLRYQNSEKPKLEIEILDPDGKLLKTVSLEASSLLTEEIYENSLSMLPDGRYTVSDGEKIAVYDTEGKLAYEIKDIGRRVGKSVITQNGKSYILSSATGENTESNVQIKEVDTKNGALKMGIPVKDMPANGKVVSTGTGAFISTGSGCYRLDITSGESYQIFDWNDTDVNRNYHSVSMVYPESDESIFVLGMDYEFNWRLIDLKKAEKNPHAGKKMIVIGAFGIQYDAPFKDFVEHYNQDESSKAHAVVIDYSEGRDTDVELAEVERDLLLDIAAGSGPDILYGFSDSSAFQSSETMVDLNTYLDGKNGISREEYFDSIFRAMEKDGKLYHAPVRFVLKGFLANTQYVSARTGWTYDEFERIAGEMPDQVSFIEGMLNRDLLEELLSNTASGLIDYTKKKVDFENDTMRRLLEISKKYGVAKIPNDEGLDEDHPGTVINYGSGDLTTSKFKNEQLAVINSYIASMSAYVHQRDFLPGKTAFLGYPADQPSGMSALAVASLGITESSDLKDEAWDFIRACLGYVTDDINVRTGMPVNQKAFENECRGEINIMEKQYKDAMSEAMDAAEMAEIEKTYLRPKESDMQEIRDIILSTTVSGCGDKAIYNIVGEEAAPFFAGDRTVEDVMKVIQNRASLVIQEQ